MVMGSWQMVIDSSILSILVFWLEQSCYGNKRHFTGGCILSSQIMGKCS
jgi:hypothetical protein